MESEGVVAHDLCLHSTGSQMSVWRHLHGTSGRNTKLECKAADSIHPKY